MRSKAKHREKLNKAQRCSVLARESPETAPGAALLFPPSSQKCCNKEELGNRGIKDKSKLKGIQQWTKTMFRNTDKKVCKEVNKYPGNKRSTLTLKARTDENRSPKNKKTFKKNFIIRGRQLICCSIGVTSIGNK